MKISITKKHISQGKPRDPENCPIALSLKEKGYHPEVGTKYIYILRGSRRIKYILPSKAKDFMCQFDTGLPVKEISFEVRKTKIN